MLRSWYQEDRLKTQRRNWLFCCIIRPPLHPPLLGQHTNSKDVWNFKLVKSSVFHFSDSCHLKKDGKEETPQISFTQAKITNSSKEAESQLEFWICSSWWAEALKGFWKVTVLLQSVRTVNHDQQTSGTLFTSSPPETLFSSLNVLFYVIFNEMVQF